MSQTIYTGPCRGGPWDGQMHTHSWRDGQGTPGSFNLIGRGAVRGSYTFNFKADHVPCFEWGPWIYPKGHREPPY